MKNSASSISPFIILLLPVVFAAALTFTNIGNEIDPQKYSIASFFKMPDFKSTFNVLIEKAIH